MAAVCSGGLPAMNPPKEVQLEIQNVKAMRPPREPLKPLIEIHKECYNYLFDCRGHAQLKGILNQYKKYPADDFAEHWIETREILVGTANAIFKCSLEYVAKTSVMTTTNVVTAGINKEIIKTFDKDALKIVKDYLKHKPAVPITLKSSH